MANQVVQLGMPGVPQATIPVQIPISTTGGQTVLQTIPFPVQILPNVMQANGQTIQVLPQLTQVIILFFVKHIKALYIICSSIVVLPLV